MTTYPDAVRLLLENLGPWNKGADPSARTTRLSKGRKTIPPLLVFESPRFDTWNSDNMFGGFKSVTEFIASASLATKHGFPNCVMCLVTVGDEYQPTLVSFKHVEHCYDVLAAVKTILAYYEGKEKLPLGFASNVASWLYSSTCRIGYGSEDVERLSDARGRKATLLFYNALLSVSDVTETPALMNIFRWDGDNPNLAYSSHQSYVVGSAARLFCREFCSRASERYNPVLAEMFEWQAREILARAFVAGIGHKYGIKTDDNPYTYLPKSPLVGALTHLTLPKSLNPPASNLLD